MAYASLLSTQRRHRQIPEISCDVNSSMILPTCGIPSMHSTSGSPTCKHCLTNIDNNSVYGAVVVAIAVASFHQVYVMNADLASILRPSQARPRVQSANRELSILKEENVAESKSTFVVQIVLT